MTKAKLNILLSNDDGVKAPGLKVMADALRDIANVTVVAPSQNRSGASSSLTLDQPLRCEQLTNGFYSVTGTPCDCVHLGSHRIMSTKPDIVIAGINNGPNLGDDVLYSGTVAAAMEGRNLGHPALAISLAGQELKHFNTAAFVIRLLFKSLVKAPLSSVQILNINVPDIPIDEIEGFAITRLGSRHRADTIVKAEDPRGKEIFWIGPPSEPQDVGPGTDFYAIANKQVSLTPLVVDFTATDKLGNLNEWLPRWPSNGIN